MFVDLLVGGGGVVFHEVCADLEREGYEVQSFIIPAASVNAPHRRDRIWFIAHSNHKGKCAGFGQIQGKNGEIPKWNDNAKFSDPNFKPHAQTPDRQRQEYTLEDGELERGRLRQPNERNFWDSFPSQSPICAGSDGISTKLDSITFSKWRQESTKAAGNAIVPQVAYEIFKTIERFENIIIN